MDAKLKKSIVTVVFTGSILVLLTVCAPKKAQSECGNTIDGDTVKNEVLNFNCVIERTNPLMEGQDILNLQKKLLLLGFKEISDAEGCYDADTEDVIKNIQAIFGFKSDGKVDKTLWDFIFDSGRTIFLSSVAAMDENNYKIEDAKNYNRIIKLTNPQMNGQDILSLQKRLVQLGFNELSDAKGYYEELTEAAIKNLQFYSGFDPDGKVDKRLWDFIFNNEKTSFLLHLVSNVLAYNSMELIKTGETLFEEEDVDTCPYAYLYYSSVDRKVKKMEYYFTPAGGTFVWTCYFINDMYSFVEFKYEANVDYPSETEEEKYLISNHAYNNEYFNIVNGILQPAINDDKTSIWTKNKRKIMNEIMEILNNFLDEK